MVSAKKKKQRRKEAGAAGRKRAPRPDAPRPPPPEDAEAAGGAEVEYVTVGLDEEDAEYKHFGAVFAKLQPPAESSDDDASMSTDDEAAKERRRAKREERRQRKREKAAQRPERLSKKMQRRAKRMSVAALKQLVARPDLVEVHDANAPDPKLLVYLKGLRNTIPIPRHWCQKRKYLSAKRGFVKPPFELPGPIAGTGITRIRAAYLEREEKKRAQQRAQTRLRAKPTKIDIDFQELHDAFFKHSFMPELSRFGEVYYEGRESEYRNRRAKPGVLTDRLRQALGMREGAPPPWLINMQRFGPPPSFPALKIPGVSAPLPPGQSYGYHPGGWGKAPVDEYGRPLYGDVFGAPQEQPRHGQYDAKLWGEAESDDEEDDDDGDAAAAADGGVSSVLPSASEADASESGIASVSAASVGTETPEIIDLRKRSAGAQQQPGQAYHVLAQQRAPGGQGGAMPSAFTYAVPGDAGARQGAEVTLSDGDVSRLQAGDTSLLRDKFDAARQAGAAARHEISEGFAEEAAMRARRAKDKPPNFKGVF